MKFNSVKLQSFLLIFYLIQTPFDGGGLELYQQAISTLVILLFWLLEFSTGRINMQDPTIKFPFTLKFFVLFLVFSSISVIWSVDRAISSWVLIYWVNQLLFFLAVYRHLIRRKDYITTLKRYILPLSALMSIWGIYQFFAASVISIGWEKFSPLGRSEAMFAQANSLGGYLSIVLILLITLYFYERRKNRAILIYFYFLLIFATFITTYSRASWISFFISTCLFLFLIGRKHVKAIFPKIIALLVGMIMTFAIISEVPRSNVLSRIQSMVGENYMPQGLTERASLWESAWELAVENPLTGTGIGTYHLAFHSKSDIDFHSIQIWMAHNDYAQFLSEIGFPGTAALLAVLGFYLFYGFRTSLKIKRTEDLFSDNALFVLGVFAASFSPLLHSIVDFNLRTSGVLALFLFLSSMLWHESEKLNIRSPVVLKLKFKLLPYPIVRALLALMAIFVLTRSISAVMADYYLKKAFESESVESYQEAINYAKKAVIMNEGLSEYHEYLGRNYLRFALFGSDSLSKVNAAFESEKEYLLAIERSPMVESYYLALATLYQNKSELFDPVHGKVAYLYEKAIYAYPASNSLRFNFAQILMKVGRYDIAAESLEHTMGRGLPIKDAQTLLAEAYRLGGNAEKAIDTINNRLKEDPADGFANFIKGNVLVDFGNLEEAVTFYLKALDGSKGDNRIDVLTQLGATLFQAKELDKAIYYLEIVLSEKPEDQFVRQLIGNIREESSAELGEDKVE